MRRSVCGSLLVFVLGVYGFDWPSSADVVTDWNDATIRTVRADTTFRGPTHSSRVFAMVHLAVYDSIHTIHRTHQPYLVDATAPEGTSLEAAASQAAHDILVSVYPVQSTTLDLELATYLSGVPEGEDKANGIELGSRVAADYIRLRSVDNAGDDSGPYPDGTLPGEWRRTPPDFSDPIGRDWGSVNPFGILSGSQFRIPPPPELDSAEYSENFNEVKELGRIDSASRTADQLEIGYFWAYDRLDPGPPPPLFNQILQTIAEIKGNSVQENARLFALANMAQADGVIACWESKYTHNFWRPVTGIREGDTDANDATIPDASWTPLGAPGGSAPDFTPPFPAYPSGHATFGGATFGILKRFYGTDDVSFTAASDELPEVTRSFSSFSQAALENGESRIYLGVHWRFDSDQGIELGDRIADFIYRNYLRPVTDADLDGDGDCDSQDLLLFQQVWHEKF